ncbi:MAG: hypothetical protein WBV60_12105, partial [Terriglobales bacterium]
MSTAPALTSLWSGPGLTLPWGLPWMTARETAALIAVVVSLLFFRAFRERCLLVWGAGWLAYGAFLWLTRAGELHAAPKSVTAFAQ